MAEFHRVPPEMAAPIAIIALALFGLIKLNLWYRAERKRMTPEERQREDEDPEHW